MSFDLNVYFSASSTALIESWKQALRERGVEVEPPPDFTLDHFSGYVPAHSDQLSEGGFDMLVRMFTPEPYLSTLAEDREEQAFGPETLERFRKAQVVATLSTPSGRSPAELQIQRLAATALAKVSDGVLEDPQAGTATLGREQQ